jgi:hypothetical protein
MYKKIKKKKQFRKQTRHSDTLFKTCTKCRELGFEWHLQRRREGEAEGAPSLCFPTLACIQVRVGAPGGITKPLEDLNGASFASYDVY